MGKITYIIIVILVLFSHNILFAQISHKSQVHQPAEYVAPFNLETFERAYLSRQDKSTTTYNQLGIAVKNRYSQLISYPTLVGEGWHKVYAIVENDNYIPTSCYEGLVYVKEVNEGEQYITKFSINNQSIDFELSGKIVSCKSNVMWQCGKKADGSVAYCGFDVYFLKDAELFNSSDANVSNKSKPIQFPSRTDNNASINQTSRKGSDEFYDGYQIVDFAKKVKFKPKFHTPVEWENAVIKVFSSSEGSAAASKQINIDAMYLCKKQADVMYRRYTSLYGYLAKTTFDNYCRLFIILIKTDEMGM